jgi:hypothetical protein
MPVVGGFVTGLDGMPGKSCDFGMNPLEERQAGQVFMKLGCIGGFPDADIPESARNAPDSLDHAILSELASDNPLLREQLFALVVWRVLGQIDRQLNEELQLNTSPLVCRAIDLPWTQPYSVERFPRYLEI